jgi:hypothetical protein
MIDRCESGWLPCFVILVSIAAFSKKSDEPKLSQPTPPPYQTLEHGKTLQMAFLMIPTFPILNQMVLSGYHDDFYVKCRAIKILQELSHQHRRGHYAQPKKCAEEAKRPQLVG